jgi:phosphoglycolate phosphatase
MFKDATIVFDLDGTLVDTAPDLTKALNDVLTRRGHAAVPAETIRACVGHGARVMIEEALRRASAQDDVDRMLAEFLVHYEANIAAESRPFPGGRGGTGQPHRAGGNARSLHQQARAFEPAPTARASD